MRRLDRKPLYKLVAGVIAHDDLQIRRAQMVAFENVAIGAAACRPHETAVVANMRWLAAPAAVKKGAGYQRAVVALGACPVTRTNCSSITMPREGSVPGWPYRRSISRMRQRGTQSVQKLFARAALHSLLFKQPLRALPFPSVYRL